ncbi:hypothetical protein C7B62_04205 [Pleurocapsa sp. CCALA 161]|uniref:hypothetical protein n=1 Tax=Pleurocapsa sp. CCALA 161 TaxID=2107688 RepID=UPI000D0858A5|nr:hypothetical protein [Pleurocapsa sp. CCALA 161]PSB11761.1 hypothetical protein C7B62_04205 [Pleurocapsa sp. CCALA 161]
MKAINSIANILRKAVDSLVISNHEPQVRYKCDRHGNHYWQVYDFNTNKSYIFGSEQDVRVWIENRHYRHYCF